MVQLINRSLPNSAITEHTCICMQSLVITLFGTGNTRTTEFKIYSTSTGMLPVREQKMSLGIYEWSSFIRKEKLIPKFKKNSLEQLILVLYYLFPHIVNAALGLVWPYGYTHDIPRGPTDLLLQIRFTPVRQFLNSFLLRRYVGPYGTGPYGHGGVLRWCAWSSIGVCTYLCTGGTWGTYLMHPLG